VKKFLREVIGVPNKTKGAMSHADHCCLRPGGESRLFDGTPAAGLGWSGLKKERTALAALVDGTVTALKS